MKKPIVCKFNGAALANADQFEKVKDIILQDDSRKYIVVSAPGVDADHQYKITDLLYNIYYNYKKIRDPGAVYVKLDLSNSEILDIVEEQFAGITQGLGLKKNLAGNFMQEINMLRQAGCSCADFVSRGGNFCARLMTEFLSHYQPTRFVEALNLIHIGLNGSVDYDISIKWIKKMRDDSKLTVIPSFYGQCAGQLQLLPRGGSDLTGALVAAAVEASVYENWKGEEGFRGILACDPNVFKGDEKNAIDVISQMSYKELRELSYMGYSFFYEEAIGSLRHRNIPVHIKSIDAPYENGTCISSVYDTDKIIRGIAGNDGFCSINVEKFFMNKEVGFGERLLHILSIRGVSYEHTPTGIDDISVIVAQNQIEEIEEELKQDIIKELHPDSVKIEKNLALIAVVGESMKNHVGIAAEITGSLARDGINIKTIDLGPSESNIIIGVKKSDYKAAVKSLYQFFFQKHKEQNNPISSYDPDSY